MNGEKDFGTHKTILIAIIYGDYIQLYTIYIKQKPDND